MELVTAFITALIGIFVTAVSSVITWRLARRKNNAEAKTTEITADSLSATLYQNLLLDAARRLNEQLAREAERDKQMEELIAAVKERDLKIEYLTRAVEKLTLQLQKYEPQSTH